MVHERHERHEELHEHQEAQEVILWPLIIDRAIIDLSNPIQSSIQSALQSRSASGTAMNGTYVMDREESLGDVVEGAGTVEDRQMQSLGERDATSDVAAPLSRQSTNVGREHVWHQHMRCDQQRSFDQRRWLVGAALDLDDVAVLLAETLTSCRTHTDSLD